MKVMIATPCYGGLVHAETAGSIALAMVAMTQAGHHVTWTTISGESLVPRARNMLAWKFLSTAYEQLLFVDGDIVPKLHDFLRILQCDADVVGGAYAKKRDGQPELVFEPMPDGGARSGPLLEVSRIGTGFLRISRDALEMMVGAYPETVYRACGGETDGATVHALFDTRVVDGRYLSEDWLFCDRWRAVGGRVWMHTDVQLGHIGSKTFRSQP